MDAPSHLLRAETRHTVKKKSFRRPCVTGAVRNHFGNTSPSRDSELNEIFIPPKTGNFNVGEKHCRTMSREIRIRVSVAILHYAFV